MSGVNCQSGETSMYHSCVYTIDLPRLIPYFEGDLDHRLPIRSFRCLIPFCCSNFDFTTQIEPRGLLLSFFAVFRRQLSIVLHLLVLFSTINNNALSLSTVCCFNYVIP